MINVCKHKFRFLPPNLIGGNISLFMAGVHQSFEPGNQTNDNTNYQDIRPVGRKNGSGKRNGRRDDDPHDRRQRGSSRRHFRCRV